MPITIGKAIEILSTNADSITEQDDLDFEDAQKLGIEALKQIQEDRSMSEDSPEHLLEGEELV